MSRSSSRNKVVPFDDNEEGLFRAVRLEFWDLKKKRPQISAFIDAKRLSLDRALGRTQEQCICTMKPRLDGNIVSFHVKDCKELQLKLDHVPSRKNYYHSELTQDHCSQLTPPQAKFLVERCSICFLYYT